MRKFDTFTDDLYQLADWLLVCHVTTVAMESTGVYWIPLYEILEACGIEVCLVNAHTTKNVSGRKSDAEDCQWIQQLHTYGLLAASFRPPADICTLRTYVRQRETLIQQRARQTQHMQKALHQMNLKLTTVISDITGVTGMQIIRAILDGEHDPGKLPAGGGGGELCSARRRKSGAPNAAATAVAKRRRVGSSKARVEGFGWLGGSMSDTRGHGSPGGEET